MHRIRPRLTYANVMSSIAIFLVLGGATAFAAHKLAKGSVGTKQLKANAVTTAKLKRNAVTTRKILKNAVTSAKIRAGAVTTPKLAKGAVTGEKIAANAVTGANIDAASTPFTQVVARLRTGAQLPFAGEPLYPIGSYTQAEGEDDQYLGAIDVSFPASCEAPREAVALLVADISTPEALTTEGLLGVAVVQDEGAGAVTRRVEFAPSAEGGSMSRLAPSIPASHTVSALLQGAECTVGSGVTVTGGLVDVLGTR
jgi:hypothetical protein